MTVLKIFITLTLIVLVSEIGKRNTSLAGFLAALPLVSLVAIVWIYLETKDTERIIKLSHSVLWFVIPSIPFFIFLPWFLKLKMGFGLSLGLSTLILFLSYGLMLIIQNKGIY